MDISRVVRAAIPLGVTAVGVTAAVGAIPTESSKALAQRWAAGLTADQKKSLLEPKRLMALPASHRRALSKSEESPEFQAQFWRAVLEAFRSSHAVSKPQQQVLQTVEQSLTPALFGPSVGTKERQATIERLVAQVENAFGADAATQIFQASGPTAGPSELGLFDRVKLAWQQHRPESVTAALRFVVPQLQATSCDCLDNGDCYYETHCNFEYASCERWPIIIPFSGCGNWNGYTCKYLCTY